MLHSFMFQFCCPNCPLVSKQLGIFFLKRGIFFLHTHRLMMTWTHLVPIHHFPLHRTQRGVGVIVVNCCTMLMCTQTNPTWHRKWHGLIYLWPTTLFGPLQKP